MVNQIQEMVEDYCDLLSIPHDQCIPELLARYPFLRVPEDLKDKPDICWLDFMPRGWVKSFAYFLLEEIREELERFGKLEDYEIFDIKEKYGELRWYDHGQPVGSCIEQILDKYATISRHVCMECGQPDVPRTKFGWIYPICQPCYDRRPSSKGLAYELEVSDENRIESTLKYHRTNRYFSEEVIMSFPETVAKIRDRWQEKQRESV